MCCPYQHSYFRADPNEWEPDPYDWEREVRIWEQRLVCMPKPAACRNISTLHTLERIYGGVNTRKKQMDAAQNFYGERSRRVPRRHVQASCAQQSCWYPTWVHQPCGCAPSVQKPCAHSPRVHQPCGYSPQMPQRGGYSSRRHGSGAAPRHEKSTTRLHVPFCENFLTCLSALNINSNANVQPQCAQCLDPNYRTSPYKDCELIENLLKEHPAGYRPCGSSRKCKKKPSLTLLVREPLEPIQYCKPRTTTLRRGRKRQRVCKCGYQTNDGYTESDSSSEEDSTASDSDSSHRENHLQNIQIQMAQISADIIPPVRKRVSGLEIAAALQRRKSSDPNAKLHKRVDNTNKAELKERAQRKTSKCACSEQAAAVCSCGKKRMDSGLETDFSNAERY